MKRAFTVAIILAFATTTNAQPLKDYRGKGSAIPPFSIEKVNGKMINNSVLKPNKPVLVVIFSPQCDHCEHALDTLQTMGEWLKNTQIVLVTEAIHKPKLEGYLNTSGLAKNPLFQNAGIDKGNLIYFIYAYGMLPQMNIYDARHKLQKTFTGMFPMDSVKMFLTPSPKRAIKG